MKNLYILLLILIEISLYDLSITSKIERQLNKHQKRKHKSHKKRHLFIDSISGALNKGPKNYPYLGLKYPLKYGGLNSLNIIPYMEEDNAPVP